jgi:enamine deaminase RidA (YjgF/YER057c/UK114 family)
MRHMPMVIFKKCCNATKVCHSKLMLFESKFQQRKLLRKTCRTFNTTHTPARANQRRRTPSTAKPCVSVIALSVQAKVTHNPISHDGHILITAISGGWDPQTKIIPEDINAQIDQAFENVELALKNAGGKGWSQVFRVNSYHIPMDDEALGAMVRNFKKWVPDHEPIWTCVGVVKLGEDAMRVEIEVSAHDPK